MKVFIDTNVLLDVLLQRELFYKDSLELLQNCENNKCEGWVSLISMANLYYIGAKIVGSKRAKETIHVLLSYLKVIGGDTQFVKQALREDLSDFEDALQYVSAIKVKNIAAIITRNGRDYKNSQVPVFTPTEFLKLGL